MNEIDWYLAVDIGGTNTKIAIVNNLGEFDHLHRFLNKEFILNPNSFLALISQHIEKILKGINYQILGIGVSIPGIQMKNETGTLKSINMPMLNRLNIKNYLSDRFQIPVIVTNDLVSHSLAEAYFGVGKGIKRFLSVSLGTGIGHTFILNGTPQKIIGGISGESGRMIIDPDSLEKDSFGALGTAEALCGVKAIENLAKQMFKNKEKLLATDVITMARENNSIAVEIMSIISRRLAILLVNLSSIYFPEVISLSGGQTEAGEFFIETCKKEFKLRSKNFFNEILSLEDENISLAIVKSSSGGLSGMVGSIVPFIYNSS